MKRLYPLQDERLGRVGQVRGAAVDGEQEDGIGVCRNQVCQNKISGHVFCSKALQERRGQKNALDVVLVDLDDT